MKRRNGFFKSLRFRILVILILIGIIPGVLAVHIVISSYEGMAIKVRTDNVQKQCSVYAGTLVRSNFFGSEDHSVQDSQLQLLANLFHGRIMIIDRNFTIVRDTYRTDEGKTVLSPLVLQCLKGEESTSYNRKAENFEIAVPVQSPESTEALGVMLVTVSSREVSDAVASMEQREILLVGIIGAVIFLLSYLLSTILVKPFARVTKSIEDLTDGYQSGDISVPDYTETALITTAFNKLLTRMKILDDSRNEFVSNVSHELKTPMTSMKVLADSLLGQPGVPEELYQEFLQDITKEIDRENKIISDLLNLVKLDRRTAQMNISHVNVNELLERILRRLTPIARLRQIDLFLDCFRTVEADLDEVKFTSAITNLVENGIKYNVDDGWVRVTLNADHQSLMIDVADSGLGIPPDSLERVFERFYRVDKSHSKEIGGTGLGLAITRSAVNSHHGTITVESVLGEGTIFHLKIPLTYIP